MNVVEAMFIGETATEHYLWLELTGSRGLSSCGWETTVEFHKSDVLSRGQCLDGFYYYEEPGVWSRKGRDVDHHISSPCPKEDDVVHTAETMLHQEVPDFL